MPHTTTRTTFERKKIVFAESGLAKVIANIVDYFIAAILHTAHSHCVRSSDAQYGFRFRFRMTQLQFGLAGGRTEDIIIGGS